MAAKPIYTADCETDPFKYGRVPQPFIWGLSDGIDVLFFDTTKEFIDHVSQIKGIVYAHNGGKFDWFYVFPYMEQFDEITIINGRIAKFKIGLCEFRDSYNILPIPLRAYKKDDFDYDILESDKRNIAGNRKKIESYLAGDCLYLHELVTAFISDYGLNLTLASSALKTWEKISGEKAPKTSSYFYDEINEYYYGGRVECFKGGIIDYPFQVIDINSAYPFAMMHQHPYGGRYDISNRLPAENVERCFIRLEAESHGAFPFRGASGLDFPNDGNRRIFSITGWEYLAAKKCGKLGRDHRIENVITFEKSISFKDYIDHFYAMKTAAKDSGDKARYTFAKLFLNSLYGKFGANPRNYAEYMLVKAGNLDAAYDDGGWLYNSMLDEMALVSRPVPEEKQRFYNVAVSASITGFVRAFLFESICKCYGVIYCDTDSIACENSAALDIDASRLGAWDIEATCDHGAVAGKKLYAFHKVGGGYKTASKGVRLTPDQIIRVASGEIVEYKPEAPSYSIKRGINFMTRESVKTC